MTTRPSVLFVCVKNGGKSQMAAGLSKAHAGEAIHVASAGTDAGSSLDELSVRSLQEIGIDLSDQRPRSLTDDLIRNSDVVVTVGREAQVPAVEGPQFERWAIDEPSQRGIEGIERMRLVRDDIAARARALAVGLGVPSVADRR